MSMKRGPKMVMLVVRKIATNRPTSPFKMFRTMKEAVKYAEGITIGQDEDIDIYESRSITWTA